MAFSDWTITGTTTGVLNSSLSNPIASGSCRSMGVTGSACSMFLNDASFIGIPVTKAIRMRGMIRRETNTSTYEGALGVKRGTGSNYGYSIAYNASPQDYVLHFNNGTYVVISHTLTAPPTSYWFSFQLDVYPIGSIGDQLVLSQETSLNSGTYSPILITGASSAAAGLFVAATDAKYAPWGGTTKNGFSTLINASGKTYIDNVSYTISDAPVAL